MTSACTRISGVSHVKGRHDRQPCAGVGCVVSVMDEAAGVEGTPSGHPAYHSRSKANGRIGTSQGISEA